MQHVVVTRFSVPRGDDPIHRDPRWLERRFELFDRYYAPSVGRLGVPAILLCSGESAPAVEARVAGLPWVRVVVQDEWHGGWTGTADQVLTRLDSDDAVHEGWFAALDSAPHDVDVHCTMEFLRFDPERMRLSAYRRRVPAPLAAFRGGRNPYQFDHAGLEDRFRTHRVPGPFLLQIFHGGNLASRRPSWYRRNLPLHRLRPFGIDPASHNR